MQVETANFYPICDMLLCMEDKAGHLDKVVSAYIRSVMKQKHVTQADISNRIGRNAQSYVSNRLNGKYSWSINDLDTIAPMLGLPDALSLISTAAGYAK